MLFSLIKHRLVDCFTFLVVFPTAWIRYLLPLSVFDPDTSVCLILDRESSLGHFFLPGFNLACHEICIILLVLIVLLLVCVAGQLAAHASLNHAIRDKDRIVAVPTGALVGSSIRLAFA